MSVPGESGVAPPIYRNLRGYALDPSLAQTLQTAPISEIVFKLPWEDLQPGPVGEYLEVIDYDPAAKCFYEPVNLNDPYLLAQDGLPPSEGTPQFHQQMAYAVAQLTIHNFERALGRLTLWSPRPPSDPSKPYDDSYFVQRLRIYPHALREANACRRRRFTSGSSKRRKAGLYGRMLAGRTTRTGRQRCRRPSGLRRGKRPE